MQKTITIGKTTEAAAAKIKGKVRKLQWLWKQTVMLLNNSDTHVSSSWLIAIRKQRRVEDVKELFISACGWRRSYRPRNLQGQQRSMAAAVCFCNADPTASDASSHTMYWMWTEHRAVHLFTEVRLMTTNRRVWTAFLLMASWTWDRQ